MTQQQFQNCEKMGEKAHHPQENGVPRPPGASSDDDMPSDPEEAADDDLDDISPEGRLPPPFQGPKGQLSHEKNSRCSTVNWTP